MIKIDKIELVDINEIKPNPRNRNKHGQDQIEMLAKHFRENGMRTPLIISNRSGLLVSGHGRLLAARRAGLSMLPVSRQEFDSDEAEYQFAIADNALADWSELDLASIHLDLPELEPFDLDLLGIKDFKLEPDPKEGLTDDDAVPENVESICKLGDIWQLGEHRLMCGDATSSDINLLMNNNLADLIHTDPPYNVDYSNQDRPKAGKIDHGRIKNDKMSDDDFYGLLEASIKNSYLYSKENASAYIWYASAESINFFTAVKNSQWENKQQIIWKKPMLLGRSKYQWAHEPCIFAIKGSPEFTSDRTKTTVWDFGGYDKSKNMHPTQKPVFLPEEAISNSSRPGDIILDLFGGSGSTLIASEKLNRKCFIMELDPHYCDVIIKRWEQYTGKKAELL